MFAAVTAVSTATAQTFPVEIENKFGTTIIETQPARVATVDYAGVDNVLALGFQPLTVRAWFGPYENHVWPWAQELLAEDPLVLSGALDFEAIASTNPDVILALRSGISAEDYEKLSAIAPVVAVTPGKGDYELGWQEQARLAALALGQSELAEKKIENINAAIKAVYDAHPEWHDKSFAMLTYWEGAIILYTNTDSSVKFVSSLGLKPHPKVDELSKDGAFSVTISEEILPELDADVVFWWAPADSPEINALPARKVMRAVKEGREVFLALDSQVNGAISHGSMLSQHEAIERVTKMIEAAIDGDVSTAVPRD
jgi:iron complex transport system substrate-binding protein